MQQTIVLLKPDIYFVKQREEWSELKKPLWTAEEFIEYVKSCLIKNNLVISAEKKILLDEETVEKHYEEHKDNIEKFNFLKSYITSWLCYIMLVSWKDAIQKARETILSIREEYLFDKKARYNMTHASDSLESAEKEISLYF